MSSDAPLSSKAAAAQLIKCKMTCSLIPGNLISNCKNYCYIHRSELHLLESRCIGLGTEKLESVLKANYTEKENITQAEFIHHKDGEMLAVINSNGMLLIYDELGQRLLHSFRSQKVNPTTRDLAFRGLVYDGKEFLFVGTGDGDILSFSITLKKLVYLSTACSDLRCGITCLASVANSSTLISGNDEGSIAFWSVNKDGKLTAVTELHGPRAPVNHIAVYQSVLVAAYASGHIRVFDIARRSCTIEIAAHSRAITGLDFHPNRPIFAVCSEDTFVSCWELHNGEVKHLLSESPVAGLLTGIKFGGDHGSLIVTSVYDSRSLALLHAP